MSAHAGNEKLAKHLAEKSFVRSEDLRKSTAELRRCATTISKHLKSLNGVISQADLAALEKATRVLRSLGAQCESAAAAKRREEQEKERIRAERRKEALSMLSARYQAKNWRESLFLALGIANASSPAYPEYSARDARSHMAWLIEHRDGYARRPPGTRSKSMIGDVSDGLKAAIESVVSSVEWRDKPVSELLNAAFPKIDAAIERARSDHEGLAAEVAAFIVAAELEDRASAPSEANKS